METNKKPTLSWQELTEELGSRFADGEVLSLEGVLFLIGVNELGQGYRHFSKDEKMELVHIATCRLLSQEGYYEESERDGEGWPQWTRKTSPPVLPVSEQEALLRRLILQYFGK